MSFPRTFTFLILGAVLLLITRVCSLPLLLGAVSLSLFRAFTRFILPTFPLLVISRRFCALSLSVFGLGLLLRFPLLATFVMRVGAIGNQIKDEGQRRI